ncbi:hypothetical protein ACFSJW_03020 [Flavobacterium artemisiae]|uniref:DUF3828 domain-containing protein n=1 Tax=Flavobacterium artemisiae TaxID=2126556 RepID=A0ABW4HK76_9FLAO
MRKTLFLLLSITAVFCNAQGNPDEQVFDQIYSPSKKENLSTEAYEVFRTNKFLDFKDKETLIEKIDESVFKKIDLNNYFSVKKDWKEIEKETIASFEKSKNAEYSFLDNTMTEIRTEYGSYDVRKEIKTVYNSKCFVLLYEKKYFVGSDYNRTESIINVYDAENRVIKITKRTEYPKKTENTESIITVKYENGTVNIVSKNGSMHCEFIRNENPSEHVSKLSPNEIVAYFSYALMQQKMAAAEEHCTQQMAQKVKSVLLPFPNITRIKSLGGTGSFGEQVKIKENWEITYDNKKERYNAVFRLIKQKNGWKIDEFGLTK